MNKKFFSLFFTLISFKLSFSSICIENENSCLKCNKETYLCDKCINEAFIPDNDGGCVGINKCSIGKNYCTKCNELGNECETCEEGYFPDKNGGCAYTENCEISYKGDCYKCNKDYFIIGKRNDSVIDFKLCKSYYSSDLKNCETINKERGRCTSCKEGYFLDDKDFKCISTSNCSTSIYGTCTQCSYGFYLNKKNNTCLLMQNQFLYCKETLDGQSCETCNDYYFLSDDKKCMRANHCSKTDEFNCIECNQGFFLAENNACSYTDNCHSSDFETGYCDECIDGFYLDLKDRICKSNQKENDFKFCKEVNGYCTQCEKGYFMGEDNRCTTTKNCDESENGICLHCSIYFYLSKDKRCTRFENCLYTNELYNCLECEDGFYYDMRYRGCYETDENFTNCKISDTLGFECAYCKDDYYLNNTDKLCYDNSKYGILYKCAFASEDGETCAECINNYYFGEKDNKCVNTEGCLSSDEKHKCLECDKGYCLNLKDSLCYLNDEIEQESEKIYYKCKKTNIEGTSCEICEDPFRVGENGLCTNYKDCEEYDGEKCVKCKEDTEWYHMCLNEEYGCVETFFPGCLKCNNIFDLDRCEECLEGYDLNEYSSMCWKN
jgi:hypothetical protein